MCACVCVSRWLSDAVSSSDYVVLNDGMVREEWIRMCKEVVMAAFEVLFWHVPGDTYENHEQLHSG